MYGIEFREEIVVNGNKNKDIQKFIGFKDEREADNFLQLYFEHCTTYPVAQFFEYDDYE